MTSSACKLAVIAIAIAGPGCFYTEPINGRPVAELEKITPGPHYKGTNVTFEGDKSDDPDGDRGQLYAEWRAVQCTDFDGVECPPVGGQTDDGNIFESFTFEVQGKTPVRVFLTVTDRSGASDITSVLVEVTNRDPEISLSKQGYEYMGAHPLGTYVDIYATTGDLDDDPFTVEWEKFAPVGAGSVEANVGWDKLPGEQAYRLTPDVEGVWQVRATIRDDEGGEDSEMIPIHFEADAPPCITATSPDATADGTYVVDTGDGPRRFAVLAVSDDLDFYPPPPSPGPFFGAAELSWKIATPGTGGAFVPIAGHEVADYFVDPEAFSPGDELQLRVEVDDRIGRTIPCADDQDTCSIGGNSCLQRVTWKAEIR